MATVDIIHIKLQEASWNVHVVVFYVHVVQASLTGLIAHILGAILVSDGRSATLPKGIRTSIVI